MLQEGQYIDMSMDTLEDEDDPWTNTPWGVQTDATARRPHKRNRQHESDLSPKCTPEPARAATACQHGALRDQIGAQVTHRWKFKNRVWSGSIS